MRSSQPMGVTQVSSQASSACAGTEDCTTIRECVRIDTRGEKQRGKFADLGAQFIGLLINRDRVQIDDAEDAFVIVLDPDPVSERAQIIADVQVAGRLHARQNAWNHEGGKDSS